jgi:acetylornithine deacetylase/succinyl-diaminopimelate desuccinylase-like protein
MPTSVIELLQELIRIPSVNPDNAPDQGATGEQACATYVGDFLQRCGAEVILEEVYPRRPNVIGRFGSHRKGAAILLAPHLDTVSVQGMTIDPFAGTLADDCIWGRGASDTKGTMAAMLWALYLRRDDLAHFSHPIHFAGFMGEEAGQPGSKHFAAKYAEDYAFAIVGEPTELATVHANKGCVWIELTATGRACHGSTPEAGDNAAWTLIRALDALWPRLAARLPGFADAILGHPTVSLGQIQGGSSPNIVPASCRAVLDCRETPLLHQAGGTLALLRELLPLGPDPAKLELRVIGNSTPLLTDPETDGIRRLRALGSPLTSAPWFCDAGRLAEQGIPAVACGPGNIAQAHTKDEFIRVADLEAGVEFYGRFLDTYR